MSKRDWYEKAAHSLNLCDQVEDEELKKIGARCIREFELDKASREEWETQADEIMRLARMKYEPKDTPFRGASNVKTPVIARAAINFSANAMGEIVRQDKTISTKVYGEDPQGLKKLRADRVEDYMNYQLVTKSTDWRDTMDKTLHVLSIIGTVFHKVYFDPICGDNTVELCHYNEIYTHNNIKSLEKAPRITHVMQWTRNELIEHIRSGAYNEIDENIYKIGEDTYEEDDLLLVYEQHRNLDLDEDGYAEPYIVTVLEKQNTVLRIQPRYELHGVHFDTKERVKYIEPIHYFVDFHFIRSMDGTFYSMGFGTLLHTITEAVNTAINQLIDAGTLCNTQTGFMSSRLHMRSGEFKLTPGAMHRVDVRSDADLATAFHMLEFKEPSQILFQLMELLDQTAKELSSSTDTMTGNQLTQNSPATSTMAMVERGMKVYNSVQKRIFRALDKEFGFLYELNKKYIDPQEYLKVMDDPMADPVKDFEDDQIDLVTVADPDISSDAQRAMQAQMAMGLIQIPGVNIRPILKMQLDVAGIKNIDEILPQQMANPADMAGQQQQQQQTAQMIAATAKQQAVQVQAGQLQHKTQQDAINSQQKQQKLALQEQKDNSTALLNHSSIQTDAALQQQKTEADILKTQMKTESSERIANAKHTADAIKLNSKAVKQVSTGKT